MTHIGTKLHDARESLPSELNLIRMQTLPHFVFDTELIELFNSQAAQSSVRVLLDHNMASLPYPEMVVEQWAGNPVYRYFWIVSQGEAPGTFELVGIEWFRSTPEARGGATPYDLRCSLAYTSHPNLLDPEARDAYYKKYPGSEGLPSWAVKWSDNYPGPGNREDMVHSGIGAVSLAILMAHMGDLDRDEITPQRVAKLNKSRSRQGRPSIHNHVIVRIGHYYDRDGVRHRLTPGTRASVRIHMRAGHTRRQHHGEQWVRDNPAEAALPWNTKDMHTVMIPPVMVNFRDGSELPLPKPRLVKL